MALAHRLASATTQLAISNAVVRMLSLATMPVLTRLVLPDAYGAASVIGTVVALCSVLALAGIDISYARVFHSARESAAGDVEAFIWRYALGAALAAGLLSGIVWASGVADLFSLPAYLAGLIALGVVASSVSTMSQTRARLYDRYRALSFATLVAGVLAAAASIAIALWWRQDEIVLVIAMLLTYAIPVLLLGVPPMSRVARSSGLPAVERIGVFKIGMAAVVTAPMFWVLSSLDRWFLLYFEDAASVGIYSIGYAVAIVGMIVNNALQAVWLPEASREFEKSPAVAKAKLGRLAEILIASLAIVWLAVTAAGGDMVRLLAAPAFHGAADVVPYIAAGVFFYGVTQLASAGLVLTTRLHYAAYWWFAGAVLCIVLNWILVPVVGRVGAAASQAIAFGFVAGGILLSAQVAFPVSVRPARLAALVGAVSVLGAAMYPAWADGPLQSLFWKLPVGVLAALIVLRISAGRNLLVVVRTAIAPQPGEER